MANRDVLIIQAARFGDLVQTARLVKSLQRDCQVHLGVDISLVDLAILLYPGTQIYGLHFHGKPDQEKIDKNEQIFSKWKEIKFTAIYNCNFSPLTEAVCRLFEREKVKGYRPADGTSGGILLSPWVRFAFRLAQKRVLSSLNLVDYWGNFTQNPISPESVNPTPRAGGRGIGIVLAGREARRSLSIKTLASLMDILNKIYKKPQFYLFGSQHEEPVAKKLFHAFSDPRIRVANMAGQTNWQQLRDGLLGLDLLICPDTGVMHLGAFLGVPVMAFFLSSAWAHETGPYGTNHIIWQAAPKCSPCLESAACTEKEKCKNCFESVEFSRLFTQFLLNPEKQLEFPEDLQLWKSGFDRAGVKLELLRGFDLWREGRGTARTYMKSFLGIPDVSFKNFSEDWINLCGKLLCPDDEWMLPRERYC